MNRENIIYWAAVLILTEWLAKLFLTALKAIT